MTDDEKKKYVDLSEADKQRYLKEKEASDTNVTRYQDKTLFSTIMFTICGLFGYFINRVYSNNCSISELLCNNSLIYIIIMIKRSIYENRI